ncbi:MAG TPA: PQQ-binding-like beta-propeller repeat protein, partial [Planctomycetaceae bacterium]|nr:PQQ-binding-like beta-propeller repeat protein [Planctomycetaceae bacterium]
MRCLLSLCLLAVCASPLMAENWPNWRGPSYNGVASGKNFPIEWSTTKNVAWKVELPGRGASTPVVWGENIFLTCGAGGQNTLLAF